MFRQLILLVSLIAIATAQSAYYAHGARQDGDVFLETIYQQTELTENSGVHFINVRVSEVDRALTYVQYNVLEVSVFKLLTFFLISNFVFVPGF